MVNLFSEEEINALQKSEVSLIVVNNCKYILQLDKENCEVEENISEFPLATGEKKQIVKYDVPVTLLERIMDKKVEVGAISQFSESKLDLWVTQNPTEDPDIESIETILRLTPRQLKALQKFLLNLKTKGKLIKFSMERKGTGVSTVYDFSKA